MGFFEGLELPAWPEPDEEAYESPESLEAPRGWPFEPYHWHRRRRSEGGAIPPELLRFGVQHSDGRKEATFGEWHGGGTTHTMLAFSDEDDPPDPSTEIIVTPCGGGGGGLDAHQRYWIWPLPPPGPVTFACEWPKLEIPETQVAIEGEVIREAAGRAERVWPPADERA